MGRLRNEPAVDPATGKTLPAGVQYRGERQYWARKLSNGNRVAKTFETAKKAGDWLKTVEVDTSRGVFVDTTAAQRFTLGSVLRSYQLEVLADDPDRTILDDDGKLCAFRPLRPVDDRMTTELLGAAQEITVIDVILRDQVCAVRMSVLSGADMAQFRNRMKVDGYAPSTIVRRLNLIARAIGVARLEWCIHIPVNPADAQHCARPRGADIKRDRVLLPAPAAQPLPPPANASACDPALLPAVRVFDGEILPPLSERDDFGLGEEERLLRSCALTPLPEPDHWLLSAVRLAIATAMRQGEICALEWPHVNFAQRTIAVLGPERDDGSRCTKNRTIRIIPMLDDAYEILMAIPRGNDRRVIKLGQNALKMRFRRAVAAAGLIDLTFHDLRHVATSRLAKIYRDPLTLRLVTGHKDLKSLARYFHKSPLELLEEAGYSRTPSSLPIAPSNDVQVSGEEIEAA
jgi:integrase